MNSKVYSVTHQLANSILFVTICFGLLGAARLSYVTITGGVPCPSIMGIPACYVVFLAYASMLFAFLQKKRPWSRPVFVSGLAVATGFALPASLLEVFREGTCPSSASGIPLCYLSLALCLLIGATWLTSRKTESTRD
jgi:hypothetical protein